MCHLSVPSLASRDDVEIRLWKAETLGHAWQSQLFDYPTTSRCRVPGNCEWCIQDYELISGQVLQYLSFCFSHQFHTVKQHRPTQTKHQTLHQTNMARARPGTATRKPGIMDRLRKRPATHQTKVTTKHSKNPVTGSHTTTQTRTTNEHAQGAHPHGAHHTAAPAHHHRRKPSMGDKISGAMMKMKGSMTRKPGVKVSLLQRTR